MCLSKILTTLNMEALHKFNNFIRANEKEHDDAWYEADLEGVEGGDPQDFMTATAMNALSNPTINYHQPNML